MRERNEKIPNPKDLEKEIGDFLSKKFGDNVKIVSPLALPQQVEKDPETRKKTPHKKLDFEMKPEELVAYLDRFVVRQDAAKAVLATKICTHFNRIKHAENEPDAGGDMVGAIKNNVLMIGPTGVGKTYIIKLIAHKLGVPFVKGDATKFSETGYVGGDVEDLIRDLVREADDDIEMAQYGIVYIDEIDKIASSRNLIGADVSRTGVQRALLKPMEETEVDLKVPHDPISMFQEIEQFRKTGSREKRTVNTKNILFIMSGAFSDLDEIIKKRMTRQTIGFGASIKSGGDPSDFLKQVRSEDLIEFGFESEFVGRLPVKTVFERLNEKDLHQILTNPNNPVILGKKLDFAAYGIDIKFENDALALLAEKAAEENTGARGLVSAVENALLIFEKRLPSTDRKCFPVTTRVIEDPENALDTLVENPDEAEAEKQFKKLVTAEKRNIRDHLLSNSENLTLRHSLTLTPSRIDIIAAYYTKHPMDIAKVIKKIKSFYDDIKKIELYFFKSYDINIVLEEEAIDFIIEQLVISGIDLKTFYRQLATDFELGLKLAREKTGKNRFFITRKALLSPEDFISHLIREEMKLPKDH